MVLGSASHPGPVLSLGAALGIPSGQSQSFAPDALMAWPRDDLAATTASTVLRVQLRERGTQGEGYRWTGGRIYVRHEATVPAPPAEARPSRL